MFNFLPGHQVGHSHEDEVTRTVRDVLDNHQIPQEFMTEPIIEEKVIEVFKPVYETEIIEVPKVWMSPRCFMVTTI